MSAAHSAEKDPSPADQASGEAAEPRPETLEELLQRLRPRLRRVLAGYHIPPQDAEDLLQEALLAAYLAWPTIQNKDAWLLVTLRHKCSIYWRGHRTRKVQAVDPEFLEDLAGAQPAPQEREELLWDLDRLLALLGHRHRELMRLRFGLGFSPDEVAEKLGYNTSSVRKLSCRSLVRLQKKAGELASYPPVVAAR
jgi:RNA polymerase sigma factor (sigma-70 family)